MQVAVENLVLNENNPRVITDDALVKMEESLLGFPSMMNYRGIIVNRQNVVLCGNMRTSALKRISGMAFEDIVQRLKSSGRDSEKNIEFWKQWIVSKTIDVILCDLSPEKEKELILKDNHEFGDFEKAKLKDLFSEEDLIYFGVDEKLFYNPKEDDSVDAKIDGAKPKKIDSLRIGDYKIEISKNEYDLIMEEFDNYVNEAQLSFGFGFHLIDEFKRHHNGEYSDSEN